MTIADFQLYTQTTDLIFKGQIAVLDQYPLIKAWFALVGQQKGIKDVHEGEMFQGVVGMINSLYS